MKVCRCRTGRMRPDRYVRQGMSYCARCRRPLGVCAPIRKPKCRLFVAEPEVRRRAKVAKRNRLQGARQYKRTLRRRLAKLFNEWKSDSVGAVLMCDHDDKFYTDGALAALARVEELLP